MRSRFDSGMALFALIVAGVIVGAAAGFMTPVNEGEIDEMRVDYEGDSSAYIIKVNGKEHKLLFFWDYNLLNVNDSVIVYFLGNVKKTS